MTNRLLSRQVAVPATAVLVVCLLLTLFFKVHEGGVRAVLSDIGFFGLCLIVLAYAAAGIGTIMRRARA